MRFQCPPMHTAETQIPVLPSRRYSMFSLKLTMLLRAGTLGGLTTAPGAAKGSPKAAPAETMNSRRLICVISPPPIAETSLAHSPKGSLLVASQEAIGGSDRAVCRISG